MKKEYTAPELQDLGSVAELTLGNAGGSLADKSLSIGDVATFLS